MAKKVKIKCPNCDKENWIEGNEPCQECGYSVDDFIKSEYPNEVKKTYTILYISIASAIIYFIITFSNIDTSTSSGGAGGLMLVIISTGIVFLIGFGIFLFQGYKLGQKGYKKFIQENKI